MIERIVLTVIALNLILIVTSIEINLNSGWQIKNANGSKCRFLLKQIKNFSSKR